MSKLSAKAKLTTKHVAQMMLSRYSSEAMPSSMTLDELLACLDIAHNSWKSNETMLKEVGVLFFNHCKSRRPEAGDRRQEAGSRS